MALRHNVSSYEVDQASAPNALTYNVFLMFIDNSEVCEIKTGDWLSIELDK